VTGSDEGGFRPHPGDPWHPGGLDDESGDEIDSAQTESALSDPESLEQEPKKRKKPKRRTRRERKADQTEADDLFESDIDKTTVDDEKLSSEGVDPVPADVADEKLSSEGVDPVPANDPFDAVLEQETPATRFRAGSDEEGPPPAWTVDKPPDPEQVFPVEQPSWIGQTTGGDPGVEAVEFESEQVEDLEEETAASSSEPDGSAADETIDVDPVFAADLQVAEAPEGDDGIVGEYGVAGPEAFDALAADDAPTGEIDDWGSYRSEPEPRRRRRFGRRKDSRDEEVIDDGFVGAATEPTASETPDASDSTFGRPAEAPAGVEAFDDWYEAEPVQKRGLFRRRKRAEPDVIEDGFVGGVAEGVEDWVEQPVAQQFEDEMPAAPLSDSVLTDDAAYLPPDEVPFLAADDSEPESTDGAGDVAAALTQALEVTGVDDDAGPVDVDASLEGDLDSLFEPTGFGEQGDLFAEPEESQPVDQPNAQPSDPAEPEGLDQLPDAELEDVAQM